MQSDFQLTSDQVELRDDIRRFVREEIDPLDFTDWEWRDDPTDRIPWHVIDAAHDRGLQDLTVPEEYGGRDASPLTLAVAAEELSAGDMGITINLDQIWKITRIIANLATDPLRDRFFSEFIDDPRYLLGIALTEPAHGSNYQTDYEGMQFNTVAERAGEAWVINGEKRYISCGPDAKAFVVYAQTDPDASAQHGTTAFFVPRESDGLEITHIWEKIAARLQNNATLEFTDVRVPEEHVLGDLHVAKRRTAEVLKEGHVESGAITLGTARRAYEAAFDYATERVQGGTEIINHQSVGHSLAEMATRLEAARTLVWTAAHAIEAQGQEYDPTIGQMAKMFAANVSADVTRDALEVFGAAGIMFETDHPIQKYLRDSVVYLHADGTENAHKEVILEALREDPDHDV